MDLTELERRLQQVGEDHRRIKKLRRDEQDLQQQLADAQSVRLEWQKTVSDASEDLRKLEGISLTGLFHSLFGDRKLRIKDESERLLQAKLRHDTCDAEIDPLTEQLADVRQRIVGLGDIDAKREELLQRKERVLVERGGDGARLLIESAEKLGALRDQLREVEEAALAGAAVMPDLQAADQDLASARSWGTLDMMGGGLITSMVKHSNIDRARSHVERAQRLLRDFVRELRDVEGLDADLSVDIGGFAKFADIFFDNLISDWFVQRRIASARDRVRDTRDRVQQMIFLLERQTTQLGEKVAVAEAQRQKWIEQAGRGS